MRILLTGASGYVGRYVAARLWSSHEVLGTFLESDGLLPGCRQQRLDLRDPEAVRAAVSEYKPDLVIHAGALANPDACERDPDLARAVNVEGTRAVARAAAERGAWLFYISTDLVFSGDFPPYREDATPSPLSVYARTKAEAEGLCRDLCPRTAVLRLSLGYGWKKPPGAFVDKLYQDLRAGKRVKLFQDQFRSALFLEDAAEMIARLAEKPCADVFHSAGPERISRFRFGILLCEEFGLDAGLVEPVHMADVPGFAPRPADCSLDGSKLWAFLGFNPRSVAEGLRAMREAGNGHRAAS
ncbi:MAG: SDR family oxidoreductase [Elusimicrobiota bacterium]